MADLRFDNRVAVITGAGRGLGRAYAQLLGARGAKVVVNDLGAAIKGEGLDSGPAEQVAQEIRDAGGEAMANTDTVATQQGGAAIIQAAMDHFGRIDILVHNAGNVRYGSLKEISQEDFDAVLDVHLRGGFHVLRPAFPLMCKAGYGRIVLTSSIGGLYGNKNVVNYGVAKAGLIGLANVAALEGAAEGVTCNVIVPSAVTRMADGLDTSKYPPLGPELVAPAVAWLCHESCTLSGEMLIAVGGRMARAYVSETTGIYQPEWTIEAVGEQIDAIRNTKQSVVFPAVPAGHSDHLRYSFAMATAGQPKSP